MKESDSKNVYISAPKKNLKTHLKTFEIDPFITIFSEIKKITIFSEIKGYDLIL